MDPTSLLPILVSSAITGIVSSIATVATIRVELKWLRRDVDDLRKRIGLYSTTKPANL